MYDEAKQQKEPKSDAALLTYTDKQIYTDKGILCGCYDCFIFEQQ